MRKPVTRVIFNTLFYRIALTARTSRSKSLMAADLTDLAAIAAAVVDSAETVGEAAATAETDAEAAAMEAAVTEAIAAEVEVSITHRTNVRE